MSIIKQKTTIKSLVVDLLISNTRDAKGDLQQSKV